VRKTTGGGQRRKVLRHQNIPHVQKDALQGTQYGWTKIRLSKGTPARDKKATESEVRVKRYKLKRKNWSRNWVGGEEE